MLGVGMGSHDSSLYECSARKINQLIALGIIYRKTHLVMLAYIQYAGT